jgi:vacuolar protein sorting-associated protein 13A/C
MSVLESLPRALSEVADADESMAPTPELSTPSTPAEELTDANVNLEPELAIVKSAGAEPELWTSLDLVFSVKSVALELYTNDAVTQQDLKANSIARFTLVKSQLGLKMLSDGAMEAEFSLKTIAFMSTRAGGSAFRDIIPATDHGGNQVYVKGWKPALMCSMLQYTKSGGADGSALAIATVDSPRFILAVDPLAALLAFAISPFKKSADAEPEPSPEEPQDLVEGPAKQSGALAFRVEIISATVIVLANDADQRSQAIQLEIKEVLLSQQSILALKIDQLGMSFGRMDKPKDRVTFLDQLNVALSLDTRRRGSQQMTSFEVEIPDPVIFRASYTDIMLIMDIVNKAIAAAGKALTPDSAAQPGRRDSVSGTRRTSDARRRSSVGDALSELTSTAIVPAKTTTARRSSVSKRRRSLESSKVLVTKEQVSQMAGRSLTPQLKVRINGFQFVLVGDLQETPMVHLSTTEFAVMVNDWSGDVSAHATSRDRVDPRR